MKYKVIWVRNRDRYEDKEFDNIIEASNYVKEGHPCSLRVTDVQLMGPETKEFIFDYYGQISACIIRLKRNAGKEITDDIDKTIKRIDNGKAHLEDLRKFRKDVEEING